VGRSNCPGVQFVASSISSIQIRAGLPLGLLPSIRESLFSPNIYLDATFAFSLQEQADAAVHDPATDNGNPGFVATTERAGAAPAQRD